MKALTNFLKTKLIKTGLSIETPDVTFEKLLGILPNELKNEFEELSKQIQDFPNKYPGAYGENSYDGQQLSESDKKIQDQYKQLSNKAQILLSLDKGERERILMLSIEDLNTFLKLKDNITSSKNNIDDDLKSVNELTELYQKASEMFESKDINSNVHKNQDTVNNLIT